VKHPDKVETLALVLNRPSCSFVTTINDFSKSDEKRSPEFFDDDSQSLPNLSELTSENIRNNPALEFFGKLHQYLDLSRITVDSIITEASNLFDSILSSVQHSVCSHLKTLGAGDDYLSEIQDVFKTFHDPFKDTRAEKQRFSTFKHLNTFFTPTHYKLGERTEFKSTPTETTREQISVVAQYTKRLGRVSRQVH
jgi:hypothetical protein